MLQLTTVLNNKKFSKPKFPFENWQLQAFLLAAVPEEKSEKFRLKNSIKIAN